MYMKEFVFPNVFACVPKSVVPAVMKANEFKSAIWIEHRERRGSARDLLSFLSLGIVGGSVIRIIADGIDEQEVVEEFGKFLLEYYGSDNFSDN